MVNFLLSGASAVGITLTTLEQWLQTPAETEQLEFKEARQQFDKTKLLRYCVALANEGGGHLILGVSDKPPRQVVGSNAFPSQTSLNSIKARILDKLRFRVDTTELQHSDGRVLIFEIPSRPAGQPLEFDGAYLMRAGEDLTAMTPDTLKRIFAETQPGWAAESARTNASPDDVIALLDTQAFFRLLRIPYPTHRSAVLDRLQREELITSTGGTWTITNLAAILLSHSLDEFSRALARKAPRIIIYESTNKLKTRNEETVLRGYAVGFESMVDSVHNAAPRNRFVEETIREEVKMFPRQALRELIANALIHQDFSMTGTSVMLEMYTDRIEISNPGLPPIQVERFIDEYRSRNEDLADLMRRFGICEEKGSGIDKVISAAELHQLPAPDFRVGTIHTTAVLFAHQDFTDMSQSNRTRACYQHCCLQYLDSQPMTNQTLRERFRLSESDNATVSQVIRATQAAELIKSDDSVDSNLYARYLPYWA